MNLKKILFTILIILLIVAAGFLWRIAPEANGYTAKYLCSLTYTSRLDPEKGMELYIKPMHVLFSLVVPELDTAHKEVTARMFGFLRPRTAVWREGCGCTLLVNSTAEDVDENTSLLGWSAAKSVTGSLIGMMVQKHGLDITVPIGLPEWQGDVRKGITINHLLRMESGLDFEENYAPLADATEMLYASADMGVFAATHPPAAGPGERWAYSSGTSNLLADILYTQIGATPQALHHLAYNEFFNRLGITTAVFEHDESDAFVGSSYLYMSARDWLRVCKLYMDNGEWNNERILPVGWVKYALTPTPHSTNGCYGAHIWLNAAPYSEDRKLPGLPPDAFMFRGFQGQWIIGIPSKQLMVARLGMTNSEMGWSPEEVIVRVLEVLKRKL